MKISQLMNNNNRVQANASIIELNNGTKLLTHYKTTVAAYIPSKGFVRSNKFHSTTTSKVINLFMGKGGNEMDQNELDVLLNNS